MLRHVGYSVTFQEIPDEVTLLIPISDCPFCCPGCHSPELQTSIGDDLEKDLPGLLEQYGDEVTCVCFMGDGKDHEAMARCMRMVKDKDLKVSIYSGHDAHCIISALNIRLSMREGYEKEHVDYIKLGPYIAAKGGLNSPTTNQRMYKYNAETQKYEDITSVFWKKKE